MLTKTDKLRHFYKRTRQLMRPAAGPAVPVFIFGEMRSGTNMLTDCFDRSISTDIYNETDERAFRGYALRADDIIEARVASSRASHVVFKSLADSGRALALFEVFPKARAFWIYRRYQDVVNSAMRKWTEHNQYLHDILHDPNRAGWRRFGLSKGMLETVRQHYERGISDTSARALIWYVRNHLFFDQDLTNDSRVMLIEYEDLVTDPARFLKRACSFVDLEFDERYFQHVSPRSIKRFDAPEIDPEIERLCASLLERLKSEYALPATEQPEPR